MSSDRLTTFFLWVFLFLTLFWLAGRAWGHEAPSGWTYPSECCSTVDCFPLRDGEVRAVPGGWEVKATGEVWPAEKTRESPDGQFHRCSEGGKADGKTLCLFAPPFGT